jgi:hypothetical protein
MSATAVAITTDRENLNLFPSPELQFCNYTKKYAMTNYNEHTVLADNQDGREAWLKTKVLLFVLPLLGLASFNVLTLTNSGAHEKGYKFLEQIARQVLPEHAVDRLLMQSPSVMKKNAITLATHHLRITNDDLVSKNRQLISDRERMAISTQALAGKTQNLAAATNRLATSTRTLAFETNTLAKEHAALRSTASALKSTADIQRAAVRQFSTRMAARSTLNVTRNVASIPGKALPFVGTGIIVAGTAWDLYDLCESLRDMNLLNAEFGNGQEDLRHVCGVTIPTTANILAQTRANWRLAYSSAVKAVHRAGEPLPATAPAVPWTDVKATVCSVVEPMPAGCSK